jgi:hypothetical protein
MTSNGGLQAVLDLAELGESMLRQRLRREEPDISDAELDARIAEWRSARPGAPVGDADGVPGNRFVDDR